MCFQLSLPNGVLQISMFSLEHIIPVILCVVLGATLIAYANLRLDIDQQKKLFSRLGWFVCLSVVAFHINLLMSGRYDIKVDLPLFLCSFMAIFIPVFTSTRKYWLYEIFVFWIIAGTTQGIITPDVGGVFPDFEYFRYWIVHLGLYIIIFYAIIVFKMRPKLTSVFKAVVGIQFYIILMAFINYFLDSNYSYLSRKPVSASILDYFGEWPTYLVVVELLVIPYFLLIYFFFQITNKKKNHKGIKSKKNLNMFLFFNSLSK